MIVPTAIVMLLVSPPTLDSAPAVESAEDGSRLIVWLAKKFEKSRVSMPLPSTMQKALVSAKSAMLA